MSQHGLLIRSALLITICAPSSALADQNASLLLTKVQAHVRDGDVAKVKAFLNQHADLINAVVTKRCTMDVEPGEGLIHWAASYRRGKVLKLLLDRGANVNLKDGEGNSPLHEAIYSRAPGAEKSSTRPLQLVELLLSQDADVNAQNNAGGTPLHYAAASASEPDILSVAKALLKRKANVNARDGSGSTPLHRAIVNHELAHKKRSYNRSWSFQPQAPKRPNIEPIVALLIRHRADVNVRDRSGETPLHVALYLGRADIAKLLLDHGAKPDVLSACALGKKEIVEEFLKAHPALVNAADRHGRTMLHWAALADRVEIVKFLLDKGANPEARTILESIGAEETPLHFACWRENLAVADLLLMHGANADAKGSMGANYFWQEFAPLHVAASIGNRKLARLLLRHKANPSLPNYYHRTPLHVAVSREDVAMAKLLLDHGAKVSVWWRPSTGAGGWMGLGGVNPPPERAPKSAPSSSPLHLAITAQNVELVRLLLKHNAKANAQDAWGDTAVHVLVETYESTMPVKNKCDKILELLLANGADVTIKDLHEIGVFKPRPQGAPALLAPERVGSRNVPNEAPLQLAARRGKWELVARLLKEKVDVNAVGLHNRTVLYHVVDAYVRNKIPKQTAEELVRSLIAQGADPTIREKPLDEHTGERFIGDSPLELVKRPEYKNFRDLLLKAMNSKPQ